MTKTFSLLCAIIGAVLLTVHSSFAAPAVLVEAGKPRFVILTDETPSAATQDAVKELNYWVKQITGSPLAVQTAGKWDGSTPYIAVGPSALARKNGWDQDPFRQEEARVFIEANRIGLLGNDNAPYPGVVWTGTYYAVLELVQKEFGVRWIWPGASGEIFTPRKTLTATPKAWTWSPQLTLVRDLRNGYNSSVPAETFKSQFGIDPNQNGGWSTIKADHARWLKRERMNKSSNVRFGHAFGDWWDRYSKNHPDWFAKPPEGLTQHGGKGVKLNISNPEVQDRIIQNWKANWENSPMAYKYLNVSPNDSRGFDTRPETRAWDAPTMQQFSDKEIYNGDKPILSDRFVRFWNILARRARAIDPEVRLSTYAYRNYRTPPLGEEKIENNIVIGYVGGEGYYPDERFIVDEWGKWAAKGAQLSWRPNLFHTGHGMPYSYSRALYNDFRFFQQHKLLGTDFDALTGNWAGQGLGYYVLAEQHSRPDATYEELAGEYFAAFGPAADSVRQYYQFFEEVTNKAPDLMRKHNLVTHMTWGGWWPAHIRLVPLFMTPEVVSQGEAILAQAEKEAQTGSPIHRERLATIRKGFEHSKIMADTFRKLQLDNPKVKMSYKDKKAILQPLWDYRRNMLTDISVSTVALFAHEQRIFNLWDAFIAKEPVPAKDVVYPLTNSWLFRVDSGNAGVNQRWFAAPTTPEWHSIAVAKPWREALPGTTESKIGWYRLDLEVPELADTGQRVFLQFKAVDAETRMWVNGVLVNERNYPHNGNYDSWNEPFEVDITQAVKSGSKNLLAIRVESEQKNAGITGNVSLVIK